MQECFYAFIGCIISAITFPFFNEDNTENGNKVYRGKNSGKKTSLQIQLAEA